MAQQLGHPQGTGLSSTLWHVHKNGTWAATQVAEVAPIGLPSWPIPVPGLITDQVIYMDDRHLYCSNWFHGEIRQYDISDPAHPRLTGQIWLGGLDDLRAGRLPR